MDSLTLEQLNKQQRYIIGVSGGPDSLMLLHLLYQSGFQLIVAHINYHKRVDSDLDQVLVENYALTYLYPIEVLEVTEYTKENFQKQARNIRYQFFLDLIEKYNANGLFIAHHQDDVLETILMQKQRKLTKTYWGINEHSNYQQMDIYRPLLDVSKQEIIDYCQEHGIVYRIDSSNLEDNYTRNKIRNIILPKYSTQEKEALLKEAKNHNYLLEKRNRYIKKVYTKYCLDGSLYYRDIKKEDLEDIIYLFIKECSQIPIERISNQIIKNCCKLIENTKPNSQINLPVNHLFIKTYDNVYISSKMQECLYSYSFDSFQEFTCQYFKLTRNGKDREGVLIKENDYPITIRSSLPGDRMLLSYGSKKVSRLFIDAKIPLSKRKTWPILLNRHGEIMLVSEIAKNKEYLMEKPTLFVVKY